MQELDRMDGTFEVEEVGLAEFILSGLSITPSVLQLGEQVTVSVRVDNVGGGSGLFQMVLQATGEADKVREYTIAAGEGFPIAFSWYPNTVGLNTVNAIGPTNTLTGTFTVGAVATPKGHILGLMVKKAGGDWQQLGTVKLILSETIQLSVSWANDSMTHSLKGHIALRLVKPGLLEYWPVPVSGQDTIVAPGGSSYVLYEIPLDQLGTWRHYEILSGAIA